MFDAAIGYVRKRATIFKSLKTQGLTLFVCKCSEKDKKR
jgi:hypothetical protein